MTLLRTVRSLDALLAEPASSRLRGPHWSFFVPAPSLAIGVAVARLEAEDVRSLVALFEAERAMPRHSLVWDTSRVGELVPDAFVTLEEFWRRHFRDELTIERVAIVAPKAGPLRAAAAGVFAFLEPPWEARAFATLAESLAWVGAPPGVAELAVREAESIASSAFDDLVSAWLDAHLASASVEACARDLGVSVRTLQRRLADAGKSFEAEANAARVRAAERRLATEASLTEIAYEAGFSSPQRFATVFRAMKGESPSEYRTRLRAR